MFTPKERTELRSDLLTRAARDPRLSGGAITGSAAAGREDQWSDIDLAFGVRDATTLPQVLSEWTARMYDQHQAVHHMDTKFESWTYRTFLLPNILQVDIAFAPATEFRALRSTFQLVFGEANEPRYIEPAKPVDIASQCWRHIFCAESCIAKGEFWQAEHFLSTLRDNALALACLRLDLPAYHARGVDSLPHETLAMFDSSLAEELCAPELSRALQVVVERFTGEIRQVEEQKPQCADSPLLPTDNLISLGWLYAVHARSCIARQRFWQAEYMIRGVRNSGLGLACRRFVDCSEPGMRPDLLPSEIKTSFLGARPRNLQAGELSRAFHVCLQLLGAEISFVGPAFDARLQGTLAAIGESLG